MAVYRRQTRVAAPFDEVWDFHSRVKGLEALTPTWMGLDVEAVRGPDDEPDPEILETGTRIRMSLRPFGVGPKQRWVSRIVARERGDDEGFFRDEMEGGPFETWIHTHRFVADGSETVLEDEVTYDLPGGGVGRAVAPLARVGFEPMFAFRHRKTKELLE